MWTEDWMDSVYLILLLVLVGWQFGAWAALACFTAYTFGYIDSAKKYRDTQTTKS